MGTAEKQKGEGILMPASSLNDQQPRAPSSQQSGDRPFYINNITTNIIMDKPNKQDEEPEKPTEEQPQEPVGPAADTKIRN